MINTQKNKVKKRCLALLKKTYCKIQPSNLGGVGVFAIRDIPKGIDMFCGASKERWISLDKKELANLDQEIKKMIDDFCVSRKNTFFIPKNGLNSIDISYFLNYSENPNCYYKKGYFFTSRKIRKGEELTANYATYDYNFKKSKKFQNLSL